MKRIIVSLVLLIVVSTLNAQNKMADKVSVQIATNLKDSLKISDLQFKKILRVNTYLQNQKQKVRETHKNLDTLHFKIQKLESMRDSMYNSVLNPDQYKLYKEKKRNLISIR